MASEYSTNQSPGGISEGHRQKVATLHRAFSGPFTVGDAAEELDLPRTKVRRLLAHWASRGWLSRVRRGLYITVPLEAKYPSQRREDPWVIAASVFEPAYIGGWSAFEHWGLTDQIFSDVVVFTSHRVRRTNQTIQGASYVLRFIPPEKMFGVTTVWRGQTRVQVSDTSRTITDVLDTPRLGGGIRHVTEALSVYFSGEHRNDELLTDYIDRLGNRTIPKRLGYLVEALGIPAPKVIDFCQANASTGYSKLDPAVSASGRLVRRWNLEINVRVTDRARA